MNGDATLAELGCKFSAPIHHCTARWRLRERTTTEVPPLPFTASLPTANDDILDVPKDAKARVSRWRQKRRQLAPLQN